MLRRQVDMERQQWLRGTLYSPAFEQDSCGFGLIAQLDDQPSHWLVSTAISSLAQLTHRGAVAADGAEPGDGFAACCSASRTAFCAKWRPVGIALKKLYAAGLVFVSREEGTGPPLCRP